MAEIPPRLILGSHGSARSFDDLHIPKAAAPPHVPTQAVVLPLSKHLSSILSSCRSFPGTAFLFWASPSGRAIMLRTEPILHSSAWVSAVRFLSLTRGFSFSWLISASTGSWVPPGYASILIFQIHFFAAFASRNDFTAFSIANLEWASPCAN